MNTRAEGKSFDFIIVVFIIDASASLAYSPKISLLCLLVASLPEFGIHACSGGTMGGGLGDFVAPFTSRKDQFSNSLKFGEKLLVLGRGTSRHVSIWVWQPNCVIHFRA